MKKRFRNFKLHLVDSTAMSLEPNPVFAGFEIFLAGMTVGASLSARFLATVLIFLGLGFMFGKTRDVSRKHFSINDHNPELKHLVHDLLFSAVFNFFLAVPIYVFSQLVADGQIDARSIGIAIMSGTIFGAINGTPMGYTIDVLRDLTGLETCTRSSYPRFIQNQSALVKKSIFAGTILASIATMALIYTFAPN